MAAMPSFTSELAAGPRPRPPRALPALRPHRHPVAPRSRALAEHARPARPRADARRRAAGDRADDAQLDDNGYVMATLPGSDDAPVVGLHRPHGHEPRRAGRRRRADRPPRLRRRRASSCRATGRCSIRRRCPSCAGKVGHDLVTSSGDTLLGADDKAGVAEIMAAVAHLAAHPELPRPTLRIGFTPDEEIGEGADAVRRRALRRALRLHARRLDARRAAGRDVHRRRGDRHHRGRRGPPGLATGKLVNAIAARRARCSPRCPPELTPERTSGREGFIHPYERHRRRRPRGDPR